MDETRKERKRKYDRERYLRNRDERRRKAREYYRQHREICIARVRLSEYRRMRRAMGK
jgi:hypothetical protein